MVTKFHGIKIILPVPIYRRRYLTYQKGERIIYRTFMTVVLEAKF